MPENTYHEAARYQLKSCCKVTSAGSSIWFLWKTFYLMTPNPLTQSSLVMGNGQKVQLQSHTVTTGCVRGFIYIFVSLTRVDNLCFNQLGGGGPQGDHTVCVRVHREDLWETPSAEDRHLQHKRWEWRLTLWPYSQENKKLTISHTLQREMGGGWRFYWHLCCCFSLSGGCDQSERDDPGLGQRDGGAALQRHWWVLHTSRWTSITVNTPHVFLQTPKPWHVH